MTRRFGYQGGVTMLEVLVSILIFSSAALGLLSVQGTAVRHTSQSMYRVEAMLLANQIIGRMWTYNTATRLAAFSSTSGGSEYKAWRSEVIAALPGVGTSTNAPTIVFDGTNSDQVTVTVKWQAPAENSVHQYLVVAEMSAL